jgi:hypothetical protein
MTKNSDSTPQKQRYDGHVDFKKLTAEQKIHWLANIVQLVKTAKKIVR